MKFIRLVLIASLLLAGSPPCWAEQGLSGSPAVAPGLQFTKIQDLDPNAPATNTMIKRKWAVVIGASRFKEDRLNSAETGSMDQSARDFYNYLIDEKAGRFDRSHVKLLLNSTATRQNIMTALGSNWLGTVTEPDDLVVVYIATSAFPTTDGNTYLCAYDCALDNIYGTCISMQTLMDTLRRSVHCTRILLVLQAAYSGAAELESGAKDLYSGFNVDLDRVVLGNGYVILSSSQPNEITWGSAFSKNLISALRSEGGLVPLQKAFAIAREQTERETAITHPGRKQTPAVKADWKGTDLIVGAPPLEAVSSLPGSVSTYLSAESCYLKATQFMSAGNVADALLEYEKAVTVDPRYADALADYGAAFTVGGDWAKAAALYERAIAVQPKDQLFHVNYARILEKLGKRQECLAELEKAYELNARDMTVLLALANVNMSLGQYVASARFLEEAAILYPANSELQERLSYVYAQVGDLDQAISHARQATVIAPLSASAQLNLGAVLSICGDTKAAILAYREASKLKPENPEAFYMLSRMLEKNGDRAGARIALAQFIRLGVPSDPRVLAARKHMQEL